MQHLEKHINNLVELNRKVIAMQNFDKFSINEAKLSYLVEAVDEGDMAKLADTVAAFKKTLDNISKQIEILTTQIVSNNDEASQAAETLTKYIDKYREALTELENVSREVDFTSGTIASFKANQMTIPGLVAASTDAIATLEAFLKGFENFKSKVVRSLVPLSKDDNQSLSQQAEGAAPAAGEGEGEEGSTAAATPAQKGKLPSVEKMINLSVEMYNTATGGDSIFDKIGKFIDKILNPIDTLKKAFQQSSDDVKKVMDKFPNFDANVLGKVTAQLMINVKVSALKGIKPTAVPNTAGIKAAAVEANKEVSKGGTADTGTAQQGQAQPSGEQAQATAEEDVSTDLNPSDLASKGTEYIQKVDVAPQGSKVTIGGTTYIKGVTTATGKKPRKRKSTGGNVSPGQGEEPTTLPTKTAGEKERVKGESVNRFSLMTIYESLFMSEAIRWYDASSSGPDEKASSADEIEGNKVLYSKIVATAAKELSGKAKDALVGVLKGEKGQKPTAEKPTQAKQKTDVKPAATKAPEAKPAAGKKVTTPTLPTAQEKKPAGQKQATPSLPPKKTQPPAQTKKASASPTLPKPAKKVKKEGLEERSLSRLFEARLIGGLGFAPISHPVEKEKENDQLNRWLQLAGLK